MPVDAAARDDEGRSEVSTVTAITSRERPQWRAVAVPSEHGGWGLTLEPVLLGLLVRFSWAGLAIGAAAFLAFLARTPVKLALVDRRRDRALPRTQLATRIAAGELLGVLVLGVAAGAAAGWSWLVPLALAAPLFVVELWFDARSRSRRLAPELCGALGITATAAAVVLAGGEPVRLAVAVWFIPAARVIASVPFVRAQIRRLHHRAASSAATDLFQLGGATLAIGGAAVDHRVVAGTVAIVLLAVGQAKSMRRSPPPAKVLGLRQMALGLGTVAVTAAGVHTLT
jgi:hypothetical protein